MFAPSIIKALPLVGAMINISRHTFPINSLFSILLFCIITLVMAEPISEFCVDGIFKNVHLLGPRMLIKFTNGDTDRITEIDAKKELLKLEYLFSLLL